MLYSLKTNSRKFKWLYFFRIIFTIIVVSLGTGSQSSFHKHSENGTPLHLDLSVTFIDGDRYQFKLFSSAGLPSILEPFME